MTATSNKYPKKLLARRGIWPLQDALDYYDLPKSLIDDLSSEVSELQPDENKIDRLLLERALAARQIAGATWIALSLGVTRESLIKAMTSPPKTEDKVRARYQKPFPIADYRWDDAGGPSKYVFDKPQVKAWINRWMPDNKTWSSIDSYAEDLKKHLKLNLISCAVSLDANESKPLVATARCVVSWDFIAVAHREYSSYPKDITLEPDSIGWHVIYHNDVSDEWLWGSERSAIVRYYESQQKS